ncbi:hemopexin repeat-containing protein [Streptomyces goshikiensis]|uniref:hemopexin repeat-containing protein n=1 Tax=Streptomyces goshikiensis TaxID=1942 RepID=UPI0033ADB275
MSGHVIDAFFTVTDEKEGLRIGYAVQGGRIARWDWTGKRMYDVDAVPLAQRWPQLPETFRQGFDAALTTQADNPWSWVFRGPQCLMLNPLDGSVAQVGTIAARFPGLPAAFAQGIDAALPAPGVGAGVNEVYFFSGSQCVRYDLRVPAPVEVKSVSEVWTGLAAKAPEFAHGLGAATVDPGTGKCYLFRSGDYTEGTLADTTIRENAAAVGNAAWPGLLPAFTRGHVIIWAGGRPVALDLETGESEQMPTGVLAGAPVTSPDGRYLYLTYQDEFSCYDMATAQVRWHTTRVTDGRRAVFSRDGDRMYFVSKSTRKLTVVDPAGPDLVATIDLHDYDLTNDGEADALGDDGPATRSTPPDEAHEDGQPVGEFLPGWEEAPPVALSPDGAMAYVGFHTRRMDNDIYRILEVDLEQRQVLQTFHLPDAGAPLDVAIDPGGRIAHVAQERGTCAIDLNTGAIAWQDVLPPCRAMKLTPDGGELWCLPAADRGGVLVAAPDSHTVLRRIPVGPGGGLGTGVDLEFNHFGTYAFVLLGSYVAVVDVAARRTTVNHYVSFPYLGPRFAYTTY